MKKYQLTKPLWKKYVWNRDKKRDIQIDVSKEDPLNDNFVKISTVQIKEIRWSGMGEMIIRLWKLMNRQSVSFSSVDLNPGKMGLYISSWENR